MKKDPTKCNPSCAPQSPGHQYHGYFQITGVVDHGDQRGRLLGFPTANIAIPQSDVRNGVWAGTVHLGSQFRRSLYVAAISIGDRPTYYSRGQSLLEANLLDYSGDLYGQTVVVTMRTLIRPQRRFAGTPELVDQIQDDVARVRSWAVGAGLGGYLREEQGTNRSLSNLPGAGRPSAIGHNRPDGGAEYADEILERRAAQRIDIISVAARELARTGNLTHETLATEIGIPVGFLLWKYPTTESLSEFLRLDGTDGS